MFDAKSTQNRKIQKLQEWRNRYSKEEYPYKVVMNMFYDLFAVESIWSDINSAFSGVKQFDDPNLALQHIGGLKRQVQLSLINQNLESFLKNDKNSKQTNVNNTSKVMFIRDAFITMANAIKSTRPDEILFCKFVTNLCFF